MALILLVDDSPTQRLYASRLLSDCGADVLLAVNGLQALNKAQLYLPDLILMDIDMPHMDGLSACRELARDKRTRDIPVIMLSSCTEPTCRLRALMRGAREYLTKPVQQQQLQLMLEKVLESPLQA